MNSISTRLIGIYATLFAIMLAVGSGLAFDQPDNEVSDAEWTKFINDDGNLVRNIVGGYILIVAAVLFMLFAVAMYHRLRAAEADPVWSVVTLVAGVGFSICLMVGTSLTVVIAMGIKIGQATPPSAELARWLPQLGFVVILVAGGLVGGLMMGVMSTLVLKTKALPAWLGYLGYVAAIALIAAAAFVPVLIFIIYMLALGIFMIIKGDKPAAAAA